MNNTEETVNQQIALIKLITSKTGDGKMCKEYQIELYKMVNKWLISDRIQAERNNKGNNNNTETRPASQKQLDLLKTLGVTHEPDIDMKTASAKIKSELGG